MPDRNEIITAARELLETEGLAALTMRALADRLGIRAPSLYKHIANKRELEIALIADGFAEQANAFEQVLAQDPDPAAEFGQTYRRWALAHPALYELMTAGPLPREELPEGVEARAAAPLLEVAGGDPDSARAAWAFAHGMVSLELADRFPPGADLAGAWRAGLHRILQSPLVHPAAPTSTEKEQ